MLELIVVAAFAVAGYLLNVVTSARPGFVLFTIVFIVAAAALGSLVAALGPRLAARPRPYQADAETGAPAQAALSRT